MTPGFTAVHDFPERLIKYIVAGFRPVAGYTHVFWDDDISRQKKTPHSLTLFESLFIERGSFGGKYSDCCVCLCCRGLDKKINTMLISVLFSKL